MDEKKAYEILSKELGPDYYIMECYDKSDGLFSFYVKEMKYKDDGFVIPETYGVDMTGRVLDFDEVLARDEREPLKEIG